MYIYKAKVIKVYDGDTITVDVDLGFGVWLKGQKIRLYGIDTPEIRGDEREDGLKSRDRVRELILDKEVFLHTVKDSKGKYGRWLGHIYLEEDTESYISINEQLINEDLAERY